MSAGQDDRLETLQRLGNVLSAIHAKHERVATEQTSGKRDAQETSEPVACAGSCAALLGTIAIIAAIVWAMSGSPPDTATEVVGREHSGSLTWVVARYILICLLTGGLIYPLVRGSSRKHFRYFAMIRPVIVAQNLGVLIVVVGFALLLSRYVPWLNRSWLYRFPVAGGESTNVNLLPAYVQYLGPMYLILLLLNLPALVREEEMGFRKGTRDWSHAFRRSLRFGLAHCAVGVPVHVGLAISVGGLWLSHQYFRGGVDRSTVHHLTYNLLVLAFFSIVVFLRLG